MDRYNDIKKVSNILNDSKVYKKIAEALGIELDNDNTIFGEIEEYIVEQFKEMDDNKEPTGCGFCGHKIEEDSIYCSYECSKADNTERV